MNKNFMVAALATAASVVALNAALAVNYVEGTGFEVATGIAQDATPGNVPALGTTPYVTFAVPSEPLNFASPGDTSLAQWLASAGAIDIQYHNGAAGTDGLDSTLWNFTGTVTVTTGQTFKAGHDDGLTLSIGGTTVISAPGPTGFTYTTSTYSGPSGNQPFQLTYGECCSPPAYLEVDLPFTSGIPEPSTWAMMLLGFAGLGFAGYRRTKKTRATVNAT